MSRLSIFSDGHDGYCVTSELDGKEFILSQAMQDGTTGVGVAVRKIAHEIRTIPTIGIRFSMLLRGMELEQQGIRLTNKQPAASAIVKREYGVSKGMSKAKTGMAMMLLIQLAYMLIEQEDSEE
jgi:hypothetical protein